MSRSKHWYNYPRVVDWLKQKGYEYHEFNNGYQLRIIGDTRIVDLWPGHMTCHIIEDEDVVSSRMSGWPKLSELFNAKELEKLLTGELQ